MNNNSIFEGSIEDAEPCRRLFSAIIQLAIEDARTVPDQGDGIRVFSEKMEAAKDAINFLFSDRIYWYADKIDLDVEELRRALLRQTQERCHDCSMTSHERTLENRKRLNFRLNYQTFYESARRTQSNSQRYNAALSGAEQQASHYA